MKAQNNTIITVALVAAILVALGILAWQWFRASSDSVAQSVYPQPMQGQPTVEQVGPPPDVVPATTPDTATPSEFKGQ